MGKHTKTSVRTVLFAAATLFATSIVNATPPCDDVTKGEGCINITGGKGVFTFSASYDVETEGKSGTLQYADTAAGFQVNSGALVDYSYLDPSVRGFVFAVSGPNYDEARVFVVDDGSTGDQFEIQLLQNGNVVYDQYGYLSPDCGGNGVIVASNCSCSCPSPAPQPEPEPQPGPGGGKGHHLKPKGNNGVGNGEDPQPPGNPPINDGPGTSPGNPGNKGGARK